MQTDHSLKNLLMPVMHKSRPFVGFLILLFCVFSVASLLYASPHEPPFTLPPLRELKKIRSAVIVTSKGKMRFELFPEDAPWHVANFKYLADKGFYRNKSFHIVIPGYIVQGGSPNPKDPTAGPGWFLPPEFSSHRHDDGTLGMARQPDGVNHDRSSNGSQFHILLNKAHHMDATYTIFGQLTNGSEVLHALEQGDLIKDVVVYVEKTPR